MTSGPEKENGCFSVGKYTVNLATRQVFCGSEVVDLPWRHFEALRVLVEAGGEPVEREKLLECIWPGITVEESSLNHCISQLRKSLGDTPESGLIQTVARRGYRLGTRPQSIRDDQPDLGRPSPQSDAPPAPAPAPRRVGRYRPWIIRAAIAVIVVAAGGVWVGRRAVRQARTHSLVQEGLQLVRQNQLPQIAAGNALLRQALQLSPDLAIAYAGLAEGMARSTQDRPGMAKEMALKGLELDPGCADCMAVGGWILMSKEWQWTPALRYLSEAARKKPQDPRARMWHAQILAVTGKLADALREADAAVAMQPGQAAPVVMRAGILYLSGNYDEAIVAARRALAYQPGFSSAWGWLYRSYGITGRFEDSLAALSSQRRSFTGMTLEKEFEQLQRWHGIYKRGGFQEFVRIQLEEESSQPIKSMMRYEHATWRMWAGDHIVALDELEGIFAVRPFDSMYVAVDPVFAPLRTEPRFAKLVARMGLGGQ